MALKPFWIEPIIWKPEQMHLLRYSQQSTGWAQTFMKLQMRADNYMLFTLGSAVPSTSIVPVSGLGTFTIGSATDPNRFLCNTAFRGSLNKPTLNDILSIEQMYNMQDFNLDELDTTLVMDSVMNGFISKDPLTQSRLTRWITDNGSEALKYAHTDLKERSSVIIYNPATGLVLDPLGSIPSTAQSAALGFIKSQVAIGIGMLDVFVQQDPANYGLKMSADVRYGISPLRKNDYGISILTYNQPTATPSV
jgi:hypothetical protein